MKPHVSAYLDAVRFAAALVVFLSHFGRQRLGGGVLWQFTVYGPEAVAVFFVLSGFVIGFVTDARERSAAAYGISRASRIYSVALPALLLTAVLDDIGSAWRPDLYGPSWGFVNDHGLMRYFTALTFSNELWGLSVQQGSNAAYWSMGYEVPFYVIFGLALYAPARWRLPLVALAVAIAGPSIAAMFPLWLAGMAAYHVCKHGRVPPGAGWALFAGSCALWLTYEAVVWTTGRPVVPVTDLWKRAEVVQDYIVGLLFAIHIIGLSAVADPIGAGAIPRALVAAVRWLAGASFTLYLCHLPVAQFLLACSPWPQADPRSWALILIGTLAAVFVIAEFTERRKDLWVRGLTALLSVTSVRRRV